MVIISFLALLNFYPDHAFYLPVNLQDSAGKCDELRAVECIMPCDRRQVKVVSVLRSLQEYQSATGTWAKPKE